MSKFGALGRLALAEKRVGSESANYKALDGLLCNQLAATYLRR